MVNAKPVNPYLSEQTRLEAQRRMLVERYGLYSDDSDDAPDDDHQHRQQPPPPPQQQQQQNDVVHPTDSNLNGATTSNNDPSSPPVLLHNHHIHQHPQQHHQQLHAHHQQQQQQQRTRISQFSDAQQNHFSQPMVSLPLPSSISPSNILPLSSTITKQRSNTQLKPDQQQPQDKIEHQDENKVNSNKKDLNNNTSDDELPPPTINSFPSIELIDHLNGNKIAQYFNLSKYKKENSNVLNLSKEARVTQIALYSSQLLETHNRKIAVSNQILSYAVGGHIRALLRHSSPRCLLKGHSSVVADIEFLSFMESRLDNDTNDHISILGSVADDGSVYVWKLIRTISASSSASTNTTNTPTSLSTPNNSSTNLSSSSNNNNSNGNTSNSNLQSAINDPNSNSFNIADAIRFEHPDYDKGKSYKRIAFRPGPNSIIAENGIGVAMLLLDMNSTDLRIVELVKMNDKMMVRDKFLKSRSEPFSAPSSDNNNSITDSKIKIEDNLQAAAWLSETTVVTSRGGYVFLWNVDNTFSTCIGYVPRKDYSLPITEIHVLNSNILIFIVGNGKNIEVWEILSNNNKLSSSLDLNTTLQNNQTIELFEDSDSDNNTNNDNADNDKDNSAPSNASTDIHCVTAIDPSKQKLFISNVKRKNILVLHFNKQAKAFDTITEIPLKNSIYSCSIAPIPSITPTNNSSSSSTVNNAVPNSSSNDMIHTGGIIDKNDIAELGVWCIQPTGIQVIHLPTSIGKPTGGNIIPDIYPKPSPEVILGKMDKKIPLLSPAQVSIVNKNIQQQKQQQQQQSQMETSAMTMKRVAPRSGGSSGSNIKVQGGLNVGSASNVNNPTLNVQVEKNNSLNRGVVDIDSMSSSKNEIGKKNAEKNDGIKNNNGKNENNSNTNNSSNNSSSKSNNNNNSSNSSSFSNNLASEEFIESILNAAKKVITTFEESGIQREANEKVKAEKLIESVAETAESNMEAFINSSMKKVLAETLIPGVSEIIADSRKAMKNKSKIETEVSRQHFEQVMEKTEITNSFNNGCIEMSRQIGQAVSTSLTGKFNCIVSPAVDVVNEAIEDLGGCVSSLKEEVKKVRRKNGQDDDEDEDDIDDDDNDDDDDDDDDGVDNDMDDGEDIIDEDDDGNGNNIGGNRNIGAIGAPGVGSSSTTKSGVRRRGRRRGGRRGLKNSTSNVSASMGEGDDNGDNVGEMEVIVVDVKDEIEELLSQGKVNDAFLTALDREDVGLVLWLCSKFDPEKLFTDHTLSQVALMSLAAQLGEELPVGDIMMKVTWLSEVVVALEPESEDIASIAMPAIRSLDGAVFNVRKDRQLLSEHVGLERKLKALSRLVSSILKQH